MKSSIKTEEMIMQITIPGSAKPAGKAVLIEALNGDYQEKVLVRSLGRPGGLKEKVIIIKGDLPDAICVKKVLEDGKALINTGGAKRPGRYKEFQQVEKILVYKNFNIF